MTQAVQSNSRTGLTSYVVISWFAFLSALMVIPLISIGGAVTTYGAGMAVPDWPTTFGENMFLYNMWESSFGVIIEHSHRLFGSLVGFLTLTTFILCMVTRGRHRLTYIAGVALLAVIIQGVMGGLRVTHNALIGRELAMLHGVFGQCTYAYLIWFWLTTRALVQDRPPTPIPVLQAGQSVLLKRLAVSLPILMLLQVFVGALHRHLPTFGIFQLSAVGTFVLHAVVGTLILLATFYLVIVCSLHANLNAVFGRGSQLLLVLILGQVVLGIVAAMVTQLVPAAFRPAPTHMEAMIRTGHVILGGLLVAGSVMQATHILRTLSFTAQSIESQAMNVLGGHGRSAGVVA